ncbi:Glutaredoxin family protein [Forsythia ovata]|uniref:Glutaredoxin family protein n=1 Tax=Forsythia ovata TaxID=205694 RepID=A0ABD1WQQ1_9LAMI
MGCASSKRVEAAVDVYRLPPSSFALFDINAIEEPWLKTGDQHEQQDEKPTHVPPPILEKLKAIEDAPGTWDEVSKALEDLKPTLNSHPTPSPPSAVKPIPKRTNSTPPAHDSEAPNLKAPRKNFSFHTLEELEAKVSSKPTELKKSESMQTGMKKFQSNKTESRIEHAPITESHTEHAPTTESRGMNSLKNNIFILRDRLEREKEGKTSTFVKRDLLSDFEEKCPPGGADSLVLYTTSLGGVRCTFENCNRLRTILETHRVVFDERDISLHGEFLNELKELVGEGVSVPRLFVKGKYIGGVEEVVSLNETGRFGRILSWTRVERGVGRLGCEGCGGARFVPCLECGGSCKVLEGDKKERCPKCNENGLVHCPICI